MSPYDSVRDLPLQIDGYSLEGLELQARPEFLRKTTVVHLRGAGEEGIGEDVTYDAAEHDRQQERGPTLPLAGDWTVHTFSQHLTTQPLFDPLPERLVYVDYRRWAFESAALDLALRQAGTSLGEVVGRAPHPITFVVSMGLGDPPLTDRFRTWLDLYPSLTFKLDANSQWTDELVQDLAATGAVDSIDFKGHYQGTTVDTPPDAALYRRVAEGLPDAWLEDPALTDETTPVLEPHRDRVTWDAPIHSVADIEATALATANGEREAVAVRLHRAAVRRVRLLRQRTGSAPTAAASGSSAPAEGTSSSSPPSSTRTRRTTSRRASSTSSRGPAFRRAR